MVSIIIDNTNRYSVDNTQLFYFNFNGANYRDVYCDLHKNNKYILEIIAKKCNLNYKGLKKHEIVDLIVNSGEIIFI